MTKTKWSPSPEISMILFILVNSQVLKARRGLAHPSRSPSASLKRRALLPSRTKILLLLPLFLPDFGDLLEVCARSGALIEKMLASGFRESYIDVVELALFPSDAVMQFETI